MNTSNFLTLFAAGYCVFVFEIIHKVQSEECNEVCEYSPAHSHVDCSNLNRDKIPDPSQCKKAKFLDFRRNDLRYLDASSLSGYGSLRYVYLEYNSIRNMTPHAFAACVELREIFLQNNPLVIIENNTFYGLSNLRNLYLNFASLESIEARAFAGLNSIERLFLKNNNLRSLPHNLFHDLRTLRLLMLSYNQLEYLHYDQFRDLAQLTHIEIQHNRLIRLESGLFRRMPSLTSLIASDNSISEIQVGALQFDSLNNLQQIDLSFNDIIDVRNISSEIVDIQKVFFTGNPMICDCMNTVLMQWYERKVLENSTLITDSKTAVICEGPEDLIGMSMISVGLEVISKCKDLPKPTLPPYDINEELGLPTVFAGRDGDLEIVVQRITDDKDTQVMPVAEGNSSDHIENSKLYMFIGITALAICLTVLIICAVLIIKKYSGSRRPRANTLDKNAKDLSPTPPTRITDNPLPEEPTGDDDNEEDVYEPIANMQEFPRSRIRLISERSVDSAFSEFEGSSPDSDDMAPPTYPPPPPPHQSRTLTGYIPVYQSKNGKVYLCTCPHSLPTENGQPVLRHSLSVPAHCSDLPNNPPDQSQPLLFRQNSLPEKHEHPTHYVPAYTCANQPNDPSHHDHTLPNYAQPVKRRSPQADIQTQSQDRPPAVMYNQNEVQILDGPPLPLQTDIADYSQLDLASYPTTNPFATQRARTVSLATPTPSSQPRTSRRVSFSDINTVYMQNNPPLTVDNPVYVQNNPVCT